MREIKFRGKRIDNNEWAYGYYHQDPEDGRFITDFEYIRVAGNFDEPPSGYFKKEFSEVKPETVGQYTGLKIKNEEIYFGDLVKAPSGLVLEIVWSEEDMGIKLRDGINYYNFNMSIYDKVGNIHTSPELLTTKQ